MVALLNGDSLQLLHSHLFPPAGTAADRAAADKLGVPAAGDCAWQAVTLSGFSQFQRPAPAVPVQDVSRVGGGRRAWLWQA